MANKNLLSTIFTNSDFDNLSAVSADFPQSNFAQQLSGALTAAPADPDNGQSANRALSVEAQLLSDAFREVDLLAQTIGIDFPRLADGRIDCVAQMEALIVAEREYKMRLHTASKVFDIPVVV